MLLDDADEDDGGMGQLEPRKAVDAVWPWDKGSLWAGRVVSRDDDNTYTVAWVSDGSTSVVPRAGMLLHKHARDAYGVLLRPGDAVWVRQRRKAAGVAAAGAAAAAAAGGASSVVLSPAIIVRVARGAQEDSAERMVRHVTVRYIDGTTEAIPDNGGLYAILPRGAEFELLDAERYDDVPQRYLKAFRADKFEAQVAKHEARLAAEAAEAAAAAAAASAAAAGGGGDGGGVGAAGAGASAAVVVDDEMEVDC